MAYKRGLADDVDRVVALDAFRRARADAAGAPVSVAPEPRALVPDLGPEHHFEPP